MVAHSQWSATDWDAPTGGTVTRTVPVRVVMELIASDGSTMDIARASDAVTLEVASTGEIRDAFISGSGSVEWLNSSSDTPTA